MGKLVLSLGILLALALAPAPVTRPTAYPLEPAAEGEDPRATAARRALGWDDRVAFRAEYSFGGRTAELLVQLRRDPHQSPLGATARVLELRRLSYGSFFERQPSCQNAFSGQLSDRGELLLQRTLPDPLDARPNRELLVSFPMRNEARTGGRLMVWNHFHRKFETVGSVRWTRLTHDEETRLENRFIGGWQNARGFERSPSGC